MPSPFPLRTAVARRHFVQWNISRLAVLLKRTVLSLSITAHTLSNRPAQYFQRLTEIRAFSLDRHLAPISDGWKDRQPRWGLDLLLDFQP
jgi:hypothetical protein